MARKYQLGVRWTKEMATHKEKKRKAKDHLQNLGRFYYSKGRKGDF